MRIFLRTQTSLIGMIRSMMRDAGGVRWTDAEMYTAVNLALDVWASRVSAPMLYALSGYEPGDAVTLPGYIRPPVQPQVQYAGSEEWVDVPDWTAPPDDTDRLTLSMEAGSGVQAARILWRFRNGYVPTTLPTLDEDIDADDDELIFVGVQEIGDAGYIKIDDEWIQYAGVERESGETTLLNLVRGVNGTTPASHAGLVPASPGPPIVPAVPGATITGGIAAPTTDLWVQLFDQAAVFAHEMFLGNASPQERDAHERAISYHTNRADMFWRRYAPARAPRMRVQMPRGMTW